ncbi:MAG: hypothetical protein ACFCU9_08120 [Cyanophyceae cyanobacterium]|jgi:hypothetical protein
MTPAEHFTLWAPSGSLWRAWVKPTLFSQMKGLFPDSLPMPNWQAIDVSWAPSVGADGFNTTALVIDLPGAESLSVGLALAKRGYCPVPTYNGCHGPGEVVDTLPLLRGMAAASSWLGSLMLSPQAPPAFLLDSRRNGGSMLVSTPGSFDNRWLIFPEDLPSANFLLQLGIQRVIVVQSDSQTVAEDLTHALLRWQGSGVTVTGQMLNPVSSFGLNLRVPRWFRALGHRAAAMMGFRKSAAGGFGSIVPEPSSSSSGSRTFRSGG